jgi:hypothetical protein
MSDAADAVDTGIDHLTDATKSLNAAVTAQNLSIGQHKEVRDAITVMVAERASTSSKRSDGGS